MMKIFSNNGLRTHPDKKSYHWFILARCFNLSAEYTKDQYRMVDIMTARNLTFLVLPYNLHT